MSNYAVYRCLYGEDFIQESIKSIDPYVEKIFVFWDDIPWGNVTQCLYKGRVISFPKKFDNILDKIRELNNPKIELIYDHRTNNVNQFTYLVNEKVLPNYPKPDRFIFIEVDHVFRKTQIEASLRLMIAAQYRVATTRAVELWRSYKYRIPERSRVCTVFWNMQGISEMPITGRQADIYGMPVLPTFVHNFGFCFNEKTMLWKHLTGLAFANAIGDLAPNEDWYDKWFNWNLDNGNFDLEISKGLEHTIPLAYKYDLDFLPEEIRKKYNLDATAR
jgi:hypothetical protein